MYKCGIQCLIQGCNEAPFQYTNYSKFHKICKSHLNEKQDQLTCRICIKTDKVLKNNKDLQIYESHARCDSADVNKIIQNKLSLHRCSRHQNIEQNTSKYLEWQKCEECYCFKCHIRGCFIAANQLNICFDACNEAKQCQVCKNYDGSYYLMKDNNEICDEHSFCINDYKANMKRTCWIDACNINFGIGSRQGYFISIKDPHHDIPKSSINNFSSGKLELLPNVEKIVNSSGHESRYYSFGHHPQIIDVRSQVENKRQISKPDPFTWNANMNHNYESQSAYISPGLPVEGFSGVKKTDVDMQELNRVYNSCDFCNTEAFLTEGSCHHHFCESCIPNQKCVKCPSCYYCKSIDFITFSECNHNVCSQCSNGYNKCLICYFLKVCDLCRNQEILCTHGYCIHLVNDKKCQSCYCCYKCGTQNVNLNLNGCVHPRCDNCINYDCHYCCGNKCSVCKIPQIQKVCDKFLHGFCKNHKQYSCIYCEPCKLCKTADAVNKCLDGFCSKCWNNCQDCLCFVCKKKPGILKNRDNYPICCECINLGNCENCYSACSSCSQFKEMNLLKCNHHACRDCLIKVCSICELKKICQQCQKKIVSNNPTCIHRNCDKCSKDCCKPDNCSKCDFKNMILNSCGHFKCPRCKKPKCDECYEAECILCNTGKIEKCMEAHNICIECKLTENSRNIKCKVCGIAKEINSVCIHRVCLDCSKCEKCKNICELCYRNTNKLCKKCRYKLCEGCHMNLGVATY